jgi:hypothetical protein
MAGIVIYQPTRDLYNGVIKATGGVGSGIAAQKTGYHDSRENNPPGNYSVILPLDKQGPADGAAAIDINLSTAKMIKFTKMFMDGLDKKDPRLKGIKEVIGTRDGRNVVRYTRSSPTSDPVWASSDSSHTWHIHISLFRAYINNWDVLKGILDFLGGVDSLDGGIMLPKLGDKNTSVGYWQRMLNSQGAALVVDNDYGNATKSAVAAWFKKVSGKTYHGKEITSWIAIELQKAVFAGKPGPAGKNGKDGKDGNAIVSGKVTIDLNTGKVS